MRISSTHTYLTRFGAILVDLLRNQDLYVLSPEDFENIYQILLNTKTIAQRPQVLSSLLRFHRFMVDRFGLTEIDAEELYALAGIAITHADAHIISPAQYQQTLSIFDCWLKESSDHWLVLTAKLVFIIQYRFWLRSGEVLRLRLIDIQLEQVIEHIRVTSTHRGKTKTFSGKRIVPALNRLSNAERQSILAWKNSIIDLWTGNPPDSALLFPDLRALEVSPDWSEIVRLISTALRSGGDCDYRPHHCRHTGFSFSLSAVGMPDSYFYELADSGLSDFIGESSVVAVRQVWSNSPQPSLRLTAQIAAALGHSSPATGIGHYFHLHPLIQCSVPDNTWASLPMPRQAEWADIGYANLRQRYARLDRAGRDARVVIDQNILKNAQGNDQAVVAQMSMPDMPVIKRDTPWANLLIMAQLMRGLQKGISMMALARVYGLSPYWINRFLHELISIQIKMRYALLSPEVIRQALIQCELSESIYLKFMREPDANSIFDRKDFKLLLSIIGEKLASEERLILKLQECFVAGYQANSSSLQFRAIGMII
ncbi:MAG: site-specific integrase [Methylococcaceae bacterium]|nr:site-specific integrase [Methylococcaceae bacterium]